MSFLTEIKRRKAFQVAAVYAVVSWLIIQIVSTVEEPLSLPDRFDTIVIVLLAIGFPITLIISWAFNFTTEGIARDFGESRAAGSSRRIEYALIGLLIIAVGWTLYRVEFSDSLGISSQDELQADSITNVVAVWPLEDRSRNPGDASYALGMHEQIINQLSKLSHLNVINAYSMRQYASRAESIEELARELDWQAVLVGSFEYIEGRIRVALTLIDPVTGVNLLPLDYERDATEIWAVQADVAMNVANALNVEFSEEESELLATAPTKSPEALVHYVRAQGHVANNSIEAELLSAIEEYEAAIDIDPSFGDAHVGLARAYQLLATMIPGRETEALRQREAAILNAMSTSPGLASTQLLLADQYVDLWQWVDAERAYLRALDLSAGKSFAANSGYGEFLLLVGRASDALEYLERAMQSEPLALGIANDISIIHDVLGNYRTALDMYERSLSLPGDHLVPNAWQRFRLLAAGDIDAAIEHTRATDVTPNQDLWAERMTFSAGDRERALAILRETYEDPANQSFNDKGRIAHWAAFLGDFDFAYQALRESVEVDDWWIRWMWDSFAEPFHSTLQFKRFLIDVGLPDYWRKTGNWPDHCRELDQSDFECF